MAHGEAVRGPCANWHLACPPPRPVAWLPAPLAPVRHRHRCGTQTSQTRASPGGQGARGRLTSRGLAFPVSAEPEPALPSRPFCGVTALPPPLQYASLEAKLCQVESKYLILLQEMQAPVCAEEQGPAREVIAQLLADALQVEGPEQPEQALVKPRLVRSGGPRLGGARGGGTAADSRAPRDPASHRLREPSPS